MSIIVIEAKVLERSGLNRVNVLGLPVHIVDMARVFAEVDRLVRSSSRPAYILAANPEKVYAVRRNPFLFSLFEKADLVIPDGIGVVLALRWLYGIRVSRVAGADLMQLICQKAPELGYRIFIYGASEEVNLRAVEQLKIRYSGINIVGRENGYVPESEMPSLIERINASQADVLFIALGSPRQEEWLNRWLPKLNVKVCQGIGGTLDTIVGRVKRAPLGWQRLGLEWFYRLVHQPSRLIRQTVLVRFALEALWARFGGTRHVQNDCKHSEGH